VRKRVAEALLTIQKRSDKNNFAISREDLASMVGTATESVIRTLSDFKDEKLIEIKDKHIEIVNAGKLSSMKN
jgi:CRP-like cAMP-binding protein